MENDNITAFHIMRTYGRHGGEQQLAQMFSQNMPAISEHFVFLYADPDCETLFARTQLRMHRLWPFAVSPRQSAQAELWFTLLLLPWLQVRLLWLLLLHRPRVCIVHGFQAAVVAWIAAVIFSSRIGFAYVHRITKSSTGRHPIFKVIYSPYRMLLGVSKAVRDSLVGLAPAHKLDVLENGIDIGRIRKSIAPKANPTVQAVICVGRLLPHKGQDIVLSAYHACLQEFPDLELWIVGDGPARVELERQASQIGGIIKFLGHCTDVGKLLGNAAIFCHASQWEGMSNAVLEAMAAGLPSVVADAPGVSECHVDGETGFVVARDSKAFAEKITTLLHDRNLCERMGKAAFDRVTKHYSMKSNRENYIRLYHTLAGEHSCAA